MIALKVTPDRGSLITVLEQFPRFANKVDDIQIFVTSRTKPEKSGFLSIFTQVYLLLLSSGTRTTANVAITRYC